MKIVSKIGFIAGTVLLAALSACKHDKPDYPVVPHIEYRSFAVINSSQGRFTLNFQDGDADIGKTSDQGPTLYYTLYGWNASTSAWDSTYTVGYVVEPMDQDGKYHPYEGQILVDMFAPYVMPPKSKFKFWLYDRAGNKSNEVFSDEIFP
jgi:hypothetical protein